MDDPHNAVYLCDSGPLHEPQRLAPLPARPPFQLLRRPAAAIAAYRDALVAHPAMARAAHRLAWLLAGQGDEASATEWFHKAAGMKNS